MAQPAVAAKAKPDADRDPAGSDKAELKRLLRITQGGDPVFVALALDASGKAIIRADRRRPARALEKELKDADPDSRNHRFGTMAADPDKPKTVQFKVNKAASGMARKLVIALKGTGFNKAEISSDDGAPPEIHQEEDEEDANNHDAAPAIDTGALVAELTPLVHRALKVSQHNPAEKAPLQKLVSSAQTSLRTAMLSLKPNQLQQAQTDIVALHDAVERAAKAPPPQPDHKPADPHAVTARLTRLAHHAAQAIKTDPGHAGEIKTHLTQAHAALKHGDLATATKHSDLLEQAMGSMAQGSFGGMQGSSEDMMSGAGGPSVPPAHQDKPHPHAGYFHDVAKAWEDTLAKAHQEADAVKQHFRKAFEKHAHGKQLIRDFEHVIQIGIDFNHPAIPLARHLYQLGQTHKDELAKALEQVRQNIKHHTEHLTSNPILRELERNPYVPVKLRHILATGLQNVQKSLSSFIGGK